MVKFVLDYCLSSSVLWLVFYTYHWVWNLNCFTSYSGSESSPMLPATAPNDDFSSLPCEHSKGYQRRNTVKTYLLVALFCFSVSMMITTIFTSQFPSYHNSPFETYNMLPGLQLPPCMSKPFWQSTKVNKRLEWDRQQKFSCPSQGLDFHQTTIPTRHGWVYSQVRWFKSKYSYLKPSNI